jgi:hypothetical protein
VNLWIIFFFCLTSCVEFNNVTADENEKLAKDPELAWYLDSLKVPQDDRFHLGGNIVQIHDRQGAAIGWTFNISARHAIPFILRPPYPPKSYPPDR